MPLALSLAAGAATRASVDAPEVQKIRSIWTNEFAVDRPSGVAYDAEDGALVVAGATEGGKTHGTRVTTGEDARGTLELPELSNPATLAFDRARKRLAAVTGANLVTVAAGELRKRNPVTTRGTIADLLLRDPRGSTFHPTDGTWYVLDGSGSTIVRVRPGGGLPTRVSLSSLGGNLRGLAFNPADGLLYTASPDQQLLYGVDASGSLKKTYSFTSLGIKSFRSFAFAPSTDNTDNPATQHLFVADAGNAKSLGRIVEAALPSGLSSLTSAAAATNESATLVQTIHTSQLSPPAPDPAGIRYIPATGNFVISDSEVDEMTVANGASWGGYQGATLWKITTGATVVDTGTTWLSYPSGSFFNREPTGVGFDAATNRLFISNDDTDRVDIDNPGPDGRHGTSDDTVTVINAGSFGATDAEDVTYDPANGHLYILDGTGREVYDLDPVDGVFANGNDVATHFDVGLHGIVDCEGIVWDPQRGLWVIADQGTSRIYEIERSSNTLVRVIDVTQVPFGNKLLGGLEMAPTSNPGDSPAAMSYWLVDRQVDNNEDPNENDGKLYELSVTGLGGGETPPAVTVTAPAEGATVSGAAVSVTANAVDNGTVTQVQFFVDGNSIGTDTNGADGWTATWNSTSVPDGPHVVSATATDNATLTGSDSNNVTVDNVPNDNPPTVTVTAPAEGATVSGTAVSVTANASDPGGGVTQVQFFVDGNSIGTDTNGADGWTGTWNTTTVADGPHTVAATARDTVNQTASDSNGVTVANATSLTRPIAVNVDDVEERLNGQMLRTDGDIDIVVDKVASGAQTIGLRFTNVTIPKNATIVNARIQFESDSGNTAAANFTIRAHAADNAPGFTTAAFNVSSRPTTTASTTWAPGAWSGIGVSGPAQLTSNFAPVLQELVNRPGWASGNAAAIIITGTGKRTAESFDGGGQAAAAELTVSYTVTPGSDTPPSVSVTAPAEGATVSGTAVSVTANASDNNGVTQVQFFVDGNSIGTDTNGADGWTATWNSTSVANGPHTVTATATDTANQTASDSNGVTVNNVAADNPPTVTLTAPAEGALVLGTVSVTANASDPGGGVTQVQFFVDGNSIGTDTNGADGWTASWNTTTVGDGPHTVTATARDTINQTASDSNGVTVDNVPADSPPTVTLTAPAEAATVSGTAVSVTANASDPGGGVTQVQFFVDGNSIGTDTNGADGWTATWNSTTVADGVHTVSATATDTASQIASDSNSVTVANATSLTRPIAVGTDDVEEQGSGNMLRTDGDLDIVLDKTTMPVQTVGLRFTNITIPKNATIVSARIQFTADSAQSGAVSLTIRGEAADNAAAFTTTAFNLTSRPTTTASTAWSPPAWGAGAAGANQLSPNFAAVLQEIVNRPAWASGNAVVIVFTGSGKRAAESFEGGGAAAAAVLTVGYTVP
ncbi:MAG TPA: Ig-like domain-containing protein [Gaiella sp.]